jgi:transcriptional regulator with XRE-family HTH domain
LWKRHTIADDMANGKKPKRPTAFGGLLNQYMKRRELTQRQFSDLAGQPNSTVSRIIYGDRRPNPDWLPHWVKVLRLDGEAAETFINAGKSARAKGKSDSADYVTELEDRIETLERFALLIGRKAIERGVQFSEESLQFLRSLEQR